MKLKYYLRGLGIGIVVTALLMGFATRGRNEMSDEEIKARAMELGMVEQRTLADMRENAGDSENTPVTTEVPQTTNTPVATQAPQSTELPVTTDAPQNTEIPVATQVPQETEQPVITETPDGTATQQPMETETPQVTEEPQETESSQNSEVDETIPPEGSGEESVTHQAPVAELLGDTVRVTIYEGNNSVNVSKVLAEAGLVENASSFDRYLRNNGYSKIINTGTYTIEIGTSEGEIARIITNTN